jgi:hypothetical protein
MRPMAGKSEPARASCKIFMSPCRAFGLDLSARGGNDEESQT